MEQPKTKNGISRKDIELFLDDEKFYEKFKFNAS